MTNDLAFFENLAGLLSEHEVVIDRPRGSAHPRFEEAVYPVDYGYLKDTVSGDGQGIDLFRGTRVDAGLVGVFVTVDPNKADAEVKLIIDCSSEEVAEVDRFLQLLHLPHHYVPADGSPNRV